MGATPNLDLYKPTLPENFHLTNHFNNNWDKLDAYCFASRNKTKKELGWVLRDDAYLETGLGYFLVGANLALFTISKVKIYAKSAPTGASLIIDVNKNGTTIFTTQGNRPEIAIDGHSDDSGTPDETSLLAGDYLSWDIDQIGSTIAGGNPVLVTVIFV